MAERVITPDLDIDPEQEKLLVPGAKVTSRCAIDVLDETGRSKRDQGVQHLCGQLGCMFVGQNDAHNITMTDSDDFCAHFEEEFALNIE